MVDKSIKMTRILINRYHQGEHPAIDSLPPEEQQLLKECTSESSNIGPALQQPWEKLDEVHYSWLVEHLQNADPEILPMLLASLPEKKRDKIGKLLGVSSLEISSLPKPIAHIMASRLYSLAELDKRESSSFLPNFPLSELLTISKDQLVDLADCLAMYDLSLEVPQIVDRKKLSSIVDALRPVQQKFLKKVLHHKGKWKPEKIGVDSWGGQKEKLLKALHKRGLKRLSLALADHSEEWRSFFLYKLDVGRANVLLSLLENIEVIGEIESLQNEVKEAIEFLRNYGR